MVEITEANPNPTTSHGEREKKKRDKLAARACVLCNQAHTACDNARPCRRCVSKGIAHLCRDSEPRKRGRPAKLPEQYDLDLARQAQKRQQADNATFNYAPNQPMQIPMAVPAPSNIMMFSPPPYEGISVQGFDLDSALFAEAQNPMDAQDFDLSSMVSPGPIPQMLPTPMPVLSSPPEYMSQQTPSPSSSNPTTPQSPQSPPPSAQDPSLSFSQQGMSPAAASTACMTISPCAPPELKFAESQMEKVFTRLAVRAGYTSMTPEIRGIMNKMVQFYSPLIQQYGNHLLDMCPVRLLSVTQMTNEMTLPVVVAGAYRVLTANSAAYELTGLKKAQFTSTYFMFDIIHKDDAVNFVRTSVDCLVNYREFDRVKIRLTLPTGEMQCIVSETVHRAHNGIPLFSSFTIVRIDDL
eukprot:Phypoly_transcript_05844.p1 GENE.Phypoly_transcript_05844~~Phypoly_transcript_05844.p1  ORF type:complete len:410 (+),score=70.69 Phypoly_transcript_05844:444-1673(+)